MIGTKQCVIAVISCVAVWMSAEFVVAQGDDFQVESLRFAKVEKVGKSVQLSTAVTTFKAPDQDVRVTLVATPQYASKEYFEKINQRLAGSNIVLFELTGAPDFLRPAKTGLKAKLEQRKATATFLATELKRFYDEFEKSYPSQLEQLIHEDNLNYRNEFLKRAIADDGFKNPWRYELTDTGFSLWSFGADGVKGGTGNDEDLQLTEKFSGKSKEEIESDASVAEATLFASRLLGWQRRTEAIPFSDPKFILSDRSNSQIDRSNAKKISGESLFPGADPDLTPESPKWHAQQAGLRVRMIQMEDPRRIPWSFMNPARYRLPKVVRKIQETIILKRNDIVTEDLEALLAQSEPPKEIAILYNTSNMYDLAERLVHILEFKYERQNWLVAGAAKAVEQPTKPIMPRQPGETDF